jgi:hypothetical protein
MNLVQALMIIKIHDDIKVFGNEVKKNEGIVFSPVMKECLGIL